MKYGLTVEVMKYVCKQWNTDVIIEIIKSGYKQLNCEIQI